MKRRLLPLSALVAALVAALSLGCGSLGQPDAPTVRTTPRPPPAAPDFPTDYVRWNQAPEPVQDERAGEQRRHYASPDARPDRGGWPTGTVLVKVHAPLDAPDVVTRVDVRRKTGEGDLGGWTYESFNPATRARIAADAEGCHLCHAAAPEDGTFTVFR
ncbi:MAG: cytochrome P460 family protein [Myxococcales bacterium]|nr:cytochrome P460 family protein [Myxococcales bacterium]